MTLWDLFVRGGLMMWPLFACSVICIAIIIERMFTLRPSKVFPKVLISEVERLIQADRLEEIELLLKAYSSPMCPIILAAIKNVDQSRQIIKDYMEEAGASEGYAMERYIDILGIIAFIAPLLGFLGTIIGIQTSYKTFASITSQGMTRFLYPGLSDALLSTVSGLVIAILAYVCYRLLIIRSDYILMQMEMTSSRILEYLLEYIKGETYEVQAE